MISRASIESHEQLSSMDNDGVAGLCQVQVFAACLDYQQAVEGVHSWRLVHHVAFDSTAKHRCPYMILYIDVMRDTTHSLGKPGGRQRRMD